jgi:hypothetical protein
MNDEQINLLQVTWNWGNEDIILYSLTFMFSKVQYKTKVVIRISRYVLLFKDVI